MSAASPLLATPDVSGGQPHAFDWAYVCFSGMLVLGAYLDSWAWVSSSWNALAAWREAAAHVGWLLVFGLLAVTAARNLSRPLPWRLALPTGYHLGLAASLVVGVAIVMEIYWTLLFGTGRAAEILFSPPHMIAIVAGAVMVASPWRAAISRRQAVAGFPQVISAALVLAALVFVTQTSDPLIDPWAASPSHQPAPVPVWVAQDMAIAGLIIQPTLIVGVMLVLIRGFQALPRFSVTIILTLAGLLAAIIKETFYLLPVVVLTGLAADWLRAKVNRSVLAAAVPAVYASTYFIELRLTRGLSWSVHLWAGTILGSMALGWIVGYLADPAAGGETDDRPSEMEPQISARMVKRALEVLHHPATLAATPLGLMLAPGGAAAGPSLVVVVSDLVRELSRADNAMDAEAGRLLLEAYVRRTGSHEVIAERLHLSRPTYYRRLQRGLDVVAERLDEMKELAVDWRSRSAGRA